MLIPSAVLHGLIFLFCTAGSVKALRGWEPDPDRARLPAYQPIARDDASWGPFDEPEPYLGQTPYGIYRFRVPVTDQPLLWKEVFHGGLAWSGPLFPNWPAHRWGRLLVYSLLTAWCFLWLAGQIPGAMSALAQGLNYPIRVVTIVLMGLWCLLLAFRAAATVCRERDQRTMESLFLLPVERTDILRAKWLGSVLRWRQIGFFLAGVWLVGLVTGALHAWAVLLLVISCGIYLAFLASLGIWLSLANRTTLWAYLSMALMLLLMITGSVLGQVSRIDYSFHVGQPRWRHLLFEVGLNPVRTWWFVGFSWTEFVDDLQDENVPLLPILTAVLTGLGFLGMAAWLLWRVSCVMFRRELERGRR